jgi:hypothetical protein
MPIPGQPELPPLSPVHARLNRWHVSAEHWLYRHGLKSAHGMPLPDFLGIGAQKSGTSWLHENLRHHPDAFVSPVKELHYFDSHFDEPLRNYSEIFKPAGNRLKGEVTPAYSILPVERIKYIRAIMPDVRLIFLMRNPIERAWSHAVMILVTQAGKSYEQITPAEFYEHFTSDANQLRGDYETIIDSWLSVFPAEQLLLGFFEEIIHQPVELLKAVCRHVGLREDVDWSGFPYRQRVYAGPGIAMPIEYERFLTSLHKERILRLSKRFGPRFGKWLETYPAHDL